MEEITITVKISEYSCEELQAIKEILVKQKRYQEAAFVKDQIEKIKNKK